MRHSSRRRLDVFLLVGAGVLVGAAGLIGALVGDTERIGDYWTQATLASDGSALIVEVIDYDFGPSSRHGILRDVRGLDPNAAISVSSPTAPAAVSISGGFGETNLRIGDPATTISNRHRYEIAYPLATLVQDSRFSWNAIGLGWPVSINNTEIHVTADREFSDVACHRGGSGARGGCDVTQVSPGHLLVEAEGLDSGEAITVEGTLGSPLSTTQLVAPVPQGPANDPGGDWLMPGFAGLGAALLAGAITSRRVRNLGREQVWQGGAAAAAFGPSDGEVVGVELVDQEQLGEMATIEFASPRGLSAAAGGIIHAEKVTSEHQIAWLIECAIRDEIVLQDDDDDFTLFRGPADPHPAVAGRLNAIFAGGVDRIELGEYDSTFATAWNGLATELEEWREASGLWDKRGDKRRSRAGGFGFLGALVGLALTVLGGILVSRDGPIWVALSVAGALIAGAGLAAMIRAWELPVRTPEGSSRWIQVESFRRFIEQSEARHAEAAAEMGLLRHYTAWAVALNELDHWKDSVEAAAKIPNSVASHSRADYHFVAMAPTLSSATTSTFTSPSDSGGGGGGAGGGGGGGGGGSW